MKMKSFIMRVISALVVASFCFMASCTKEEAFTDTDTEEKTDMMPSDTVYNDTEKNTDTTDNAQPDEKTILDLKWNLGYVASSTHGTKPNQLVTGSGGGNYSYTDVFTVEKAGTTITFVDDNLNSNADLKFASSSAYVISSWKKQGDEWTLDLDGANYAGSSTMTSDVLVSYKDGVATYSYTTTLDKESLRLCFRSGQTSSFTPASYPKVISEYTGKEGTAEYKLTLKKWIEDSKTDFYSSALEGLTVNALGDSYFAGQGLPAEQIWINLMAKKYGMSMNNYGIGGSTVSKYVTDKNPMCDRYDTMAANGADIILVEGGRNDFNSGVPIGTVDSSDETTYSGALNVIIDGIQEKYPDAMIVCISPWNFPNASGKSLTYVDYADAMQSVAERQGVYFIRACDSQISGIDMRNSAFREQYCIKPTDVSHLNCEGMKIAMPHFEKVLAEYYQDFIGKKG